MTSATSQLEYAARPRDKRATLRRIVGLLVLASIGFAAWRFGPVIYIHTGYLYSQHRLMSHELPADKVVLSLDPSEVDTLLKRGYFHVDVGARGSRSYDYGGVPPTAGYRSPTFVTAGPFLNLPLNGAGVFMHSRRTSSTDDERLVMVQTCELESTTTDSFNVIILAQILRPANLSLNSQMVLMTFAPPVFMFKEPPLRIYAGQIDPADDSHFLIPFDTATQRSILHGFLLDDKTIDWKMTPAPRQSEGLNG